MPTVEVNGKALELGTPGRSGDFAGVHKSPYKIPTPWSAMYYFKIDAAVVASLGAATSLNIRVLEPGKDGPVKTLFAPKSPPIRAFEDFAAR